MRRLKYCQQSPLRDAWSMNSKILGLTLVSLAQILAVSVATQPQAVAQGSGEFSDPAAESPSNPKQPTKQTKENQSKKKSGSSSGLVAPMVRVEGGCFQMGTPASENALDSDERRHEVCVKGFRIGKYEVTQHQWEAVMGSNPSRFSSCSKCPVEQVSWIDVQDYLDKLNGRTGERYRLPTEAEWEYACRSGGKDQRYCGGSDIDRVAWHLVNSGGTTHPVGGKRANGLGLHDMSGNAWEWTCSAYDAAYGGAETRCESINNAGHWSIRGGSSSNPPNWVRSADRTPYVPGNRNAYLGFRLVQD